MGRLPSVGVISNKVQSQRAGIMCRRMQRTALQYRNINKNEEWVSGVYYISTQVFFHVIISFYPILFCVFIILEPICKHQSSIYLSLQATLVRFILESIGNHYLGLYLSLQATINWVYTRIYRQTLVGFILESIGKHQLGLYQSLQEKMGAVYNRTYR